MDNTRRLLAAAVFLFVACGCDMSGDIDGSTSVTDRDAITGEGDAGLWQAVARPTIGGVVAKQQGSACRTQLTALGVNFSVAPATRGVSDPVTVRTPINGLHYYSYGSASPQSSLMMDCSLALALHRFADVTKPRGIVAVEHIGIYNYRCIGGGDPDSGTCTPSQHAQAKAIDIHELRDAQGVTYNVETDWVIDPDSEPTCSAQTANSKDSFLHQVACSWNANRVFAIILTPNYNADHRNHFHVDLSAGSNFINVISPSAVGVDPLLAGAAH